MSRTENVEGVSIKRKRMPIKRKKASIKRKGVHIENLFNKYIQPKVLKSISHIEIKIKHFSFGIDEGWVTISISTPTKQFIIYMTGIVTALGTAIIWILKHAEEIRKIIGL